jgi:hypothetical protein
MTPAASHGGRYYPCLYAHPYVSPFSIWILLNNLGSSKENHLKFILKVSDLKRKAKFEFGYYHFFRSGVKPSFTLSRSRGHMCPMNTFFHFFYILFIFYLIKGTGKTLIGCMVVSKMLEQNPTRQVIFLVDRGLLVLQQYQYIKRELGDIIFTR